MVRNTQFKQYQCSVDIALGNQNVPPLFVFQGYKYVKTDSDECCGKCVQTHCVVNINGAKQLLSVSWLQGHMLMFIYV